MKVPESTIEALDEALKKLEVIVNQTRVVRDHKISTHFMSTPQLWSAVFDNYDGAPDANPSAKLMGIGPTELTAIADLLYQERDYE